MDQDQIEADTFEKRTTCPKCKLPGDVALAITHRDRAKTYSVTCMNDQCRWHTLNWLVDVNPDGSLPVVRPHVKAYPSIPDKTEQVQAALDAEIARSLRNKR